MFLWFAAGATAEAGKTATSGGWQSITSFLPIVLIFVVMWFLLIRPQKKQQDAHRKMLAAMKKGDKVVTAGGLIGEITILADDEITLRIADKVEVRTLRSAITRVLSQD